MRHPEGHRPMALADLVVFVHIEKCAGTSLNFWLSSSHHYGNLYIRASNIPMNSLRWDDIRPVDLEDPALRSIASHHLRTYPDTIHGRTLRYITLLREPVARWISFVRFMNRLKTDDGSLRSLRDYAEWALEQPEERLLSELNGQTNFIAEHEWYRRNHSDVIAIDWSADPALFARYRRERLAFAKTTLARFDAVGTVEDLGGFVRLLRSRAGAWDVPLLPRDELEYSNVTAAPAVDTSWISPGDSIGRRLLDALAEDFELYRFAREINQR
jgi:hypothetical protein